MKTNSAVLIIGNARKEASETAYRLRLLYECNSIGKKGFDSIFSGLYELIAILTAIIRHQYAD